mgnify:CR=1 FL=1
MHFPGAAQDSPAQEILELWRGKEPKNPEVQKLTASLLTRKFSQTAQAVAAELLNRSTCTPCESQAEARSAVPMLTSRSRAS